MNLLDKKHHMKIETEDEGYRTLTCSCGFSISLPDSYWPKEAPSFGWAERHLQHVILAQLSIDSRLEGRY